MANEWQSLLQQSPNIAGQDLIKNFQSAYSTAQEQKKTAYEQYRLQKAQDITSKARRADGTMDWDAMFKLGSEAGIGLDAFNQVHKMQSERRASEVANAQNRMVLESMGYDPSSWDPSAGPRVQAPASGVPYQGPSTTDYGFVAPTAPETQIPQAAPATFSAQGVGETAQTSVAPSAPVQAGPQDVVVPGTVAPKSEGYYNELWRAQRDPEAMKRLIASGSATATAGAGLSIQNMNTEEIQNLGRYLALRGISSTNPQEGLSSLENMAIQSVPPPALNPMIGMLSKDEQAKEWGRYNQAVAEYPAKVQDARVKLSEAIRTGNYDVLDKSISVAGNRRAEERQEYDLSAQKGNIFIRPVSSEEARVVKQQRAAISDIIAAPDSFAGAYQAAVAKAKSDGSVNEDAIVSNLVAMGALPSSDAIYLKTMMNPDGSLTAAGKKWVVNATVGQRGPNAEWKANAITNINQYIHDNGGRMVEFTATPPQTTITEPTVTTPKKPVQSPTTEGKPLSGVTF
jgi:hypothetical protein